MIMTFWKETGLDDKDAVPEEKRGRKLERKFI